jgi:hypothetical protein
LLKGDIKMTLDLADFENSGAAWSTPIDTGSSVADPGASGQGGTSWVSGLVSGVGSLISLISGGVAAYAQSSEQVRAANKIAADSSKAGTTAISTSNLIKIGAVVAVGVVAILLLRKR